MAEKSHNDWMNASLFSRCGVCPALSTLECSALFKSVRIFSANLENLVSLFPVSNRIGRFLRLVNLGHRLGMDPVPSSWRAFARPVFE